MRHPRAGTRAAAALRGVRDRRCDREVSATPAWEPLRSLQAVNDRRHASGRTDLTNPFRTTACRAMTILNRAEPSPRARLPPSTADAGRRLVGQLRQLGRRVGSRQSRLTFPTWQHRDDGYALRGVNRLITRCSYSLREPPANSGELTSLDPDSRCLWRRAGGTIT